MLTDLLEDALYEDIYTVCNTYMVTATTKHRQDIKLLTWLQASNIDNILSRNQQACLGAVKGESFQLYRLFPKKNGDKIIWNEFEIGLNTWKIVRFQFQLKIL